MCKWSGTGDGSDAVVQLVVVVGHVVRGVVLAEEEQRRLVRPVLHQWRVCAAQVRDGQCRWGDGGGVGGSGLVLLRRVVTALW